VRGYGRRGWAEQNHPFEQNGESSYGAPDTHAGDDVERGVPLELRLVQQGQGPLSGLVPGGGVHDAV